MASFFWTTLYIGRCIVMFILSQLSLQCLSIAVCLCVCPSVLFDSVQYVLVACGWKGAQKKILNIKNIIDIITVVVVAVVVTGLLLLMMMVLIVIVVTTFVFVKISEHRFH